MVRSISEIYEILFGSDEESESSEGTDSDGGFVPSEMDLSVRVGHGGQEDDVAREIAKVQKQVEEIEDQDRK